MRQFYQIATIFLRKRIFSCAVLFSMMKPTQTDCPSIGRLQARTAVRSLTHVSTFDRELIAIRDGTLVTSHPSPVGGTTPANYLGAEADAKHG